MPPFVIHGPQGGAPALPLVCDSPHSGTHYPADFRHAVARAILRQSEDTHVDALWAGVPACGGTLVCATFPRSYIDPNREEADIDVTALDGTWPHTAKPSQQCTALGNGLVWMRTPTRHRIYDRPLAVAEVMQRIETCWRPYHQALRAQLERAHRIHGGYWHLNLHSMPSNAFERLGLSATAPLADVVLGDRHGSSCDAAFRDAVSSAFTARGYTVALNTPYAGLELVRLAGAPAQGRHSLQVEVNRALYMDERTREPNPNFHTLKQHIHEVLAELQSFIAQQLQAWQAHPASL